jgi:hypothetical protein
MKALMLPDSGSGLAAAPTRAGRSDSGHGPSYNGGKETHTHSGKEA